MSKQPVKIRRYPILKLVGYLYKVFAVLAVVAAIGGTALRFADLFVTPYQSRDYGTAWAQIALMLIAGGITGLICGTLGQMIDVLLSTNEYMRQMVEMTQYEVSLLRKAIQPNQVKIQGD